MTRSFSFALPASGWWRDAGTLIRIGLGLLLAANLVAAFFAFHLAGPSPAGIDRDVASTRLRLLAAKTRLERSRTLAGRIAKGREQGASFLDANFTSRRHTYSTIIAEITDTAKKAGMTMKEATISPLDAIEGSDDLDMMTISVNFEGGYGQLIKFLNLLDRSPRFLIVESLQATPQPKGDILTVGIKLNTFIREEPSGEGLAPAAPALAPAATPAVAKTGT